MQNTAEMQSNMSELTNNKKSLSTSKIFEAVLEGMEALTIIAFLCSAYGTDLGWLGIAEAVTSITIRAILIGLKLCKK